MSTIKIAIPTDEPDGMNGKRSGHFGHCKEFTLVDIENGAVTNLVRLDNIPHPAGGCMAPVQLLKDNQVDSIVVGGIGANPFKRFEEVGIKVIFADLGQCPDVQSAVDGFLSGKLQEMQLQQSCKGSGTCH